MSDSLDLEINFRTNLESFAAAEKTLIAKATEVEEAFANISKSMISSSMEMIDGAQAYTMITQRNLSIQNNIADSATRIKNAIQGELILANQTEKAALRMMAILNEREDYDEERLEKHKEMKLYNAEELKFLKFSKMLLDAYAESVSNKNILHGEELDLVKQERMAIEANRDSMQGMGEQVNQVKRSYSDMIARAIAMIDVLQQADSATEKFRETNYRAYGTQQQLVNSTRMLSAEYGVLADDAVEIYKNLIDMKTPREEVDKLAKTVAMASRTTGVGVGQLSSFARSMRAIGLDTDATQSQIAKMTEAMRKYGLSQEDVNQLTSTSVGDMLQLQSLFGGNAQEVAKFQMSMTQFAGIAKQMGFGAEVAMNFQKTLSDPVAWARLGGYTGVAIKDAKSLEKAMFVGGKQMLRLQKKIEAASRAGNADLVRELNMQFNQLATNMFGSADAGRVAAKQTSEINKLMKEQNLTFDQATEKFKELNNTIENQYNESMATLTANMQKLSAAMNAAFNAVMAFVADGLSYLLEVIVPFVQWVSKGIVYLAQLANEFEKSGKIGYFLIGSLKILAAVLVLGGVGFISITAAIGSYALALGSASGVVRGSLKIIVSHARAMERIAEAIGNSIKALLTGIADGIAALGKAAGANAKGLLVLSIAVIALGAGIWMTAKGIELFVEMGWKSVAMLGAVAAIMFAFTAGMVVLANAVKDPITAAALALLAVVLLAFGAAALMAGVGVKLIADAALQLSEVPFMNIVSAMGALAIGIGLIAVALYFATPSLLAGGVALMVFGAALYVVGLALPMIVENMERLGKISGNNLKKVGLGLVGVAVGLAAFGAANVIAGLGNLVSGFLSFISGQKSPVDQLILLGQNGPNLVAAGNGIKDVAEGLSAFNNLNMSSLATGLGSVLDMVATNWWTGSDPVEPLVRLGKAFGDLGAASVLINANLSQAMQAIKDVISLPIEQVESNLNKLKGVLNLSLSEIASAAGWALLGQAMSSVSGSIKALGEGLAAITMSMEKMTLDNIMNFATNFRIFAEVMGSSVKAGLRAGAALALIGAALLPGATAFAYSSAAIFKGGEDFAKGAEKIASGVTSLDKIGTKMITAGVRLAEGAAVINAGWKDFRNAAMSLYYSGNWLDDAGSMIAKGLNAIADSAEKFKKSLDAFSKMQTTLVELQGTIDSMSKLDVEAFALVFKRLVKAADDVKRFATKINSITLVATHDNIVVPLQNIAKALADVTDNIAKAQEAAAEAAEEKAETINQVQVMLSADTIGQLEALRNQVSVEALEEFKALSIWLQAPERQEIIAAIRALLAEWLPEIARKSMLGSEFNAWSR